MKIFYYETNLGKFYRHPNHGLPSYGTYNMLYYRFNDMEPEKFFIENDYGLADNLIVKKKVNSKKVVTGYRIINPALVSDKIPEYINGSLMSTKYLNGENVWVGPYGDIMSLYSAETMMTPEDWEVDEIVEFIKIRDLKIDNYEKPEEVKVDILEERKYDGPTNKIVDFSSVVVYDDLVKLSTPEFMWHTKPCAVPSPIVYSIIRNYIKEKIDRKYARIASDYDFCFSVVKIVSVKPYNYSKQKYTPRGNSYKPPKYTSVLVDKKELKIFDMTHTGTNYSGYVPVAHWFGDNLQDLIDNMKAYLDDLINTINEPVTYCTHCDGTGHINKFIGTNER